LQQVEAALHAAGTKNNVNDDLVKLQTDLCELIQLTEGVLYLSSQAGYIVTWVVNLVSHLYI